MLFGIIKLMSKNSARTYARYRTNISRRGNEKFTESDGVFFLKLVILLILSSFWIKLNDPLSAGGIMLTGFPLGMLVAFLLVRIYEKRTLNRKIWYSVVLIATILSYFLPSGIVI